MTTSKAGGEGFARAEKIDGDFCVVIPVGDEIGCFPCKTEKLAEDGRDWFNAALAEALRTRDEKIKELTASRDAWKLANEPMIESALRAQVLSLTEKLVLSTIKKESLRSEVLMLTEKLGIAEGKVERLEDYLIMRRNVCEKSLAAEILAGNVVKQDYERTAIVEIDGMFAAIHARGGEK